MKLKPDAVVVAAACAACCAPLIVAAAAVAPPVVVLGAAATAIGAGLAALSRRRSRVGRQPTAGPTLARAEAKNDPA